MNAEKIVCSALKVTVRSVYQQAFTEVSMVSQEKFSEFNICFLYHCTVLLYSCLSADGIS